ncbi:hypothetical protein G9A89_018367 [Geosiphon pyriformis]|nr:hypothetical protein G9A89_018367 [Geosiphon pyriformis]
MSCSNYQSGQIDICRQRNDIDITEGFSTVFTFEKVKEIDFIQNLPNKDRCFSVVSLSMVKASSSIFDLDQIDRRKNYVRNIKGLIFLGAKLELYKTTQEQSKNNLQSLKTKIIIDNNMSQSIASNQGFYTPSVNVLIRNATEIYQVIPPDQPNGQQNNGQNIILEEQNVCFTKSDELMAPTFHSSYMPTNSR